MSCYRVIMFDNNHQTIDTVEEYDIVSNTWRILDWKLPWAMSKFAAWFDPFDKTFHVAFGDIAASVHTMSLSNIYYKRQFDSPIYDQSCWTIISTCPVSPSQFEYCL
jgi:hypothetical protein